jgi:ribosomal protein S2
LVEVAIPANDDAVGSIKVLISHLAQAYKQGRSLSKSQEEKAVVKKEEEKTEETK